MMFFTIIILLGATILVAVVTNGSIAAVDVKVKSASLEVRIVEVAPGANVVSLLIIAAVPILAAVFWISKIAQLVVFFTETSLPAVRLIFPMAPLGIITRPGSTENIFRVVAIIALFLPQQSLSVFCSTLVMRKASLGAVEKAEAVVLIDQKVFIGSRILRADFVLLRRGQTINTGAVTF